MKAAPARRALRALRGNLAGRRGSIRTHLIVWNIVGLALLLGTLGLLTRSIVTNSMMNQVDQDLEKHLQPPPHYGGPPGRPPEFGNGPGFRMQPGPYGLQQDGHGPPDDGSPHGFDGPGRPHASHGPQIDDLNRPYHYDLNGQSAEPIGPHRHGIWDPYTFDLAKHGRKELSTVTENGEPFRILSAPMRDHGSIIGVVQAVRPLGEINSALANLSSALLTLIPVGLLFAGLGGAFLTDRVLARVRRLSQAAGRIGARSFAERLPVTGNDEFSELADTFNGLLGRLEAAFTEQRRLLELQRRFTGDASHELKTPLTIIKGNTSMALDSGLNLEDYRQTLREIDRAADSMSSLVQDLLLLARSDEGQMGKDRIELLAREVLERAVSSVAHRKGAPVTLQLADNALTLPGNEGELVRLFTNLLDNASRYTPPEGHIAVRAARQGNREAIWIVVTIADTGAGIAPEHLPHLGERFYRVDSSRSRPAGGTGLGLSICKSIVDAHGGTIAFQSKVGVGTTVTVTLPAGDGDL